MTEALPTGTNHGLNARKISAHLSYSIEGAHINYIQQALAATRHLVAVASRGMYSSERAQACRRSAHRCRRVPATALCTVEYPEYG